uniref:LIM zinc-binding domain-containing protein n=1 Tax=Trichuris muris TaxID=70415 RepID=A0A5S6Q8G0_TRIMR
MSAADRMICSVCCQRPSTNVKCALGRLWCQNHFCCNTCNIALVQDYHSFREKAYCPTCFGKILPKCKSCGKPLREGKEYREANGEIYWHMECFICSKCNKPVDVSKFGMNNDKLLCAECAQK